MMDSYHTVSADAHKEIVIQRSRFIGHTHPVNKEEEALAFIENINNQYRDASHNCYAYMVGLHQEIQRFQDNGEPSGTAGMPILEVIKNKGLTNVVVVVTRYFGGILLGAGGLVRAYSQTTAETINEAEIVNMLLSSSYEISMEYSFLGKVENFIRNSGYLLQNTIYLDKVSMQVLVKKDETGKFLQDMAELSDGTIAAVEKSSLYYPW